MTARRVALLAALLVVLGAMVLPGTLPSTAQQPPIPPPPPPPRNTTVALFLEPEDPMADLDPPAYGAVNINGTVNVSSLLVVTTTVTITVDSGSWFYLLSDDQLIFAGPGSQSFTVNVTAPPNATLGDSQTVTVTANWSSVPTDETGQVVDSVPVGIKQSYKVQMFSTKSFISIAPGAHVDLKLKVTNSGNGDDSYEVELLNLEALRGGGWTVTGMPTTVSLKPRAVAEVAVGVDVPTGLEPGREVQFQFHAISKGAQQAGQLVDRTSKVTFSIKKDTTKPPPGNNTTTPDPNPNPCGGIILGSVLAPAGAGLALRATDRRRLLALNRWR